MTPTGTSDQEKLNVEIVLETNYIQMCVGTKVSREKLKLNLGSIISGQIFHLSLTEAATG